MSTGSELTLEQKKILDEELLSLCWSGNNVERVTELLSLGADPNCVDEYGDTPLLIASEGRHKVIVELLLNSGADYSCTDEFGSTPLHMASERGHKVIVELLLNSGADYSCTNEFGSTPLHMASRGGHEVIVELLLNSGADYSCTDMYGHTPLHMASRGGHEVIVELLLNSGADYSCTDEFGSTPLHMASRGGHEVIVELLLNSGADYSCTDMFGSTPLHMASERGHEVIVELLLNSGADYSCTDKYGHTPLHMASRGGHEVIVELLLNSGADYSCTDEYGHTPLHMASRGGHEVIVELLLNSGADYSCTNEFGHTPLHMASGRGHKVIVELLLNSGADYSCTNEFGSTPLHMASRGGHEVIVELLLNSGADYSCTDMYGHTPLHMASRGGHEVIVELLLNSGADYSCTDEFGSTPLHMASRGGHEVIVELLLNSGADYSCTDMFGSTPLHMASERGHEVIVELLLNSGADYSCTDKYGHTPLHMASRGGHEVIVELLLNSGADYSCTDEYGHTPLHMASRGGHEVIVELLLNSGADYSCTNEFGHTPLHMASGRGHKVIVEKLLFWGADHSSINQDGDTPLHLSASWGHESVMEILIEHGADVSIRNKDGLLFGKTPFNLMNEYKQEYNYDVSKLKQFASDESKKKKDMMKVFSDECQRNGTVDMLPIKCVLTGLPGVGKTSFLKRVEKKLTPLTVPDQVRKVIPSTGFEKGVTVNISEEAVTSTHAALNAGGWVTTNNLHDQAKFMLSAIKHPIDNNPLASSVPSSAKAASKHSPQPNSFGKSVTATKIDLTKDLPSPSKKNPIKKRKKMESALHLMKNAVHRPVASNRPERLTTVCFLDTGGQPEFHDLLPFLLHGSALHMIFFNAFLDLFKSINVVYRHEDPAMSSVEYETSSSSIEIIYQLLVSFFTISKKENHQCVAALFGSYIDKFNEQQRPEELKRVSKLLEEAFGDAAFIKEDFLASSNNPECPFIFQPLDNMTCSEEELEKVLNFLTNVIQKRFSPVSVPVTWAAFHLTLRQKYEKSVGICSMEECTALAQECRIPVEHVSHVLEFFHFRLGTILHFNEVDSLKNFVIVDPNILFQGISNLVTMSFIDSGEHSNVAAKVRKSGEIPAGIIRPGQQLSDGCPLTNQDLINLLVHFKLMHIFSESSSYFMPCLLLPDPDVVKSLVSLDVLHISPPPLLVLFKEGYVPVGLFPGVVNELSKTWILDKSNRFRNRVTFIYPPGVVELRQCIKYIEVRAIHIESHCNEVRKVILDSLESVTRTQPHLKESKFFFGFYCPGSLSSNHPHPSRYIPTGDSGIICLKDPKCYSGSKSLPIQCGPWLGISKPNVPVRATNEAIEIMQVDDSPLAIDDHLAMVLGECFVVTDWETLGIALKINKADLERIKKDESKAIHCQTAMFEEWINTGEASWRNLVKALLYPPLKAEDVAKVIADNHKKC